MLSKSNDRKSNNGHSSGTVGSEPITSTESQGGTPADITGVRLLNLDQAAKYICVSPWSMREYILNGDVPAVKLPCPTRSGGAIRKYLIDRRDLDALIEGNKEVRTW